jgi:phospholipase/lecithinase/hemolysin
MNMFRRLALSSTVALSLGAVSFGQHYTQTNLQANTPGVAEATDPQLVNSWGLSRTSSSAWWVADNVTTVPITDQVSEYLRGHERFTSRQLVVINGGANDVFFNLEAAQLAGTASAQQAAMEAIRQAAVDLVDVANTVVENGATRVVLFNLPDIGTSPQGVASADHGHSFTQISQLFNSTLANTLQQRNLTNKVLLIDSFTIIDSIIANFRDNGFTVANTATACNLQAQIARATQLHLNNPTEFGQSLFCSPKTLATEDADHNFMFADMVHPTTHLSTLFAHIVEKQLATSELGR